MLIILKNLKSFCEKKKMPSTALGFEPKSFDLRIIPSDTVS